MSYTVNLFRVFWENRRRSPPLAILVPTVSGGGVVVPVVHGWVTPVPQSYAYYTELNPVTAVHTSKLNLLCPVWLPRDHKVTPDIPW